ncbi:hypothetical protein KIPB_013274, partial [Kipferlia bialata]
AQQDLYAELGFQPLGFNQAYQFDTLPDRYESHTEMKRGDLIFYQGVYKRENAKQQRHHMVHVEMYLGPDERCVGSRFRTKTIREFDSFKFNSTKWDLEKMHFCSIDPWLDGVCASSCPVHQWGSDLETGHKMRKSSIFYTPPDEMTELESMNAGSEGEGEGEQGEGEGESPDKVEVPVGH